MPYGAGTGSDTNDSASSDALPLVAQCRYGTSMALKMTFTLDDDTAARIDRTALRLGIAKSAVVREAVAEFAARAGRLSEQERQRMLAVLDDFARQVPVGPTAGADQELAALRRARVHGGRRTRADSRR